MSLSQASDGVRLDTLGVRAGELQMPLTRPDSCEHDRHAPRMKAEARSVNRIRSLGPFR